MPSPSGGHRPSPPCHPRDRRPRRRGPRPRRRRPRQARGSSRPGRRAGRSPCDAARPRRGTRSLRGHGPRAAPAPAPRRSAAAARPPSIDVPARPADGSTLRSPSRFTELVAGRPRPRYDPHAAEYLQHVGPAGVQPDLSDREPSAGERGRREQERGRGDVAGHRAAEAPVAERPQAREARPRVHRRAQVRQDALGVVAGRRRLARPWSPRRPRARPAARPPSPGRSGPGRRARSRGAARPTTVTGARPPVVRTSAPIARSGSATRSIGRADRLSSPVRVASNAHGARTPASRRIVVPEFPHSTGPSGCPKRHSTLSLEHDRCSVEVQPCSTWNRRPSRAGAAGCEAQASSAARSTRRRDRGQGPRRSTGRRGRRGRPRSSLRPSAVAARISQRCAIDLSPGTRASPVHGAARRDHDAHAGLLRPAGAARTSAREGRARPARRLRRRR